MGWPRFDAEVAHGFGAAGTLAAQIDDFERIDHMSTRAEGRRNAALREVERHRAALARRLQEAVTEIEDAKFEDITPPGVERAA